MAKKEDVPVVTEADVQQAWDDLDTARAEVENLRKRFVDGDESVAQSDIASQRGVVEWLEMVAERAEGQRKRYLESDRLKSANALYAEIEQYATGIGKTLADQARTYFAERQQFLALAKGHNATVAGFASRAVDLNIPVSNGRPVPFARDGRLALPQGGAGGGIQAGRRVLSSGVDGPSYLERLDRTNDIDGVAVSLEGIDPELPEPTAQFFYEGPNGGVYAFDRERTTEELKIQQLKPISRREAWGDDDE